MEERKILFIHGNRSSGPAFRDRFGGKSGKRITKKLDKIGCVRVFYNAPYPWVEPGCVAEADGAGGEVTDQPDEPRQWWPQGLSIPQVPEVADRPIPNHITIDSEDALAAVEAFIREHGITAIVAHSQGGHMTGLLMRQLEASGDNPISHVVLINTYNSRWPGDSLTTPALVYHCQDDAVVPFKCRPTVGEDGLWANGIEYVLETGGHHIPNSPGRWTRICAFLNNEPWDE
jgi:pimeloyl-ACP methyl ester carboxylesterase